MSNRINELQSEIDRIKQENDFLIEEKDKTCKMQVSELSQKIMALEDENFHQKSINSGIFSIKLITKSLKGFLFFFIIFLISISIILFKNNFFYIDVENS